MLEKGLSFTRKVIDILSELKECGFTKEEAEYSIKLEGKKFIVKFHKKVWQTLKNFFETGMNEIDEIYKNDLSKIKFIRSNIVEIIDGGSYGTKIFETLVYDFIEGFKAEKRKRIFTTKEKIRVNIDKLNFKNAPNEIDVHYKEGYYKIVVAYKNLNFKRVYPHSKAALNEVTEIDLFLAKHKTVTRDWSLKDVEKGCKVTFKIRSLCIVISMNQEEADKKMYVSELKKVIIPSISKFEKSKNAK